MSLNLHETQLLERIAKATERTAQLLEALMIDDGLIEEQAAKYPLANPKRLVK